MTRSAARVCRSAALSILTACAVVLPVRPAAAHGEPVELRFWGGFSRAITRCQAVISRAASRCVGDVLAARRACLDPSLHGAACDTPELDRQVGQLRQASLAPVAQDCTSLQLQQLRYADLSDAYRDIIDVCRRLDTAVVSAVYLPARVDGAVTPVEADLARCIVSVGRASVKLLEFSTRRQRKALDRIAATRMAPEAKDALVARAAQRVALARQRLQARVAADCSPVAFADAYAREPDHYLEGIAAQADCHSQYVYVQRAVQCPATACGNGILEPGEQCDDANGRAGDGCGADCRRE